MIERGIAPVGPGWIEDREGTAHLLVSFAAGEEVLTAHGWLRVRPGMLVFSYLHQPERPCGDCYRARLVHRIGWLSGQLL